MGGKRRRSVPFRELGKTESHRQRSRKTGDEVPHQHSQTFKANAPMAARSKRPLLIPVRLGLLDKAGQEMPLCLDGENRPTRRCNGRLIFPNSETVEFIGIENDPVVSALRRLPGNAVRTASRQRPRVSLGA